MTAASLVPQLAPGPIPPAAAADADHQRGYRLHHRHGPWEHARVVVAVGLKPTRKIMGSPLLMLPDLFVGVRRALIEETIA